MKAKDKFLKYCNMFKRELADLQAEIDYEQEGKQWHGTLAYIGANYSYELANIGFELGYSTWFFMIADFFTTADFGALRPFSFEEIKENVCNTIISNERIEQHYTEKEIEDIKKRILKCKENF